MNGFEIPQGAMPDPVPAAPPPDPAMAREQAIADTTRAEEALNGFIAAKQHALFEAPDSFYRTEGSDAIHAAPAILDTLSKLRDDHLAGLANDAQRDRLEPALDAHLDLARDDIARHVAKQSLAWQRRVAQDRIALLTKEAALHHNDDTMVDALGEAAATAARAHARVGDGLDQQAEDAAAAYARSGALGSAIQARFDRGDADGANALLTRVNDQLDPEHADALKTRLESATGNDGASQVGTATASGVALPAAEGALGGTAKAAAEAGANAITRIAPYVGPAAAAVAAAAPVLLIPSNSGSTTTDLGDGLRIRKAPGQLSVTIERRVGDGVLGTGIGERWETLPVQATDRGPLDGRPVIAVDSQQLEKAIGVEAAGRLLQQPGIAMADPPDDSSKPQGQEQTPGVGHNSDQSPEPENEPTPPPPVDREAAAQARKIAEDALSSGILGKRSDSEQDRRETRQAAGDIAAHAYEKHKDEFPEVHSPGDFVNHIESVLNNATDSASDEHGCTIYWHAPSGTFVARNRDDPSAGTALKPSNGKEYYDEAKRRMDRQRREGIQ